SHEGRVGEARGLEVPERPKLKLLPCSKPIEAAEPSPVYVKEKQDYSAKVTGRLQNFRLAGGLAQITNKKT
ncbi:hypothetical protein E2562_006713, partial [Oryza meyeriana var. granulata]